MNLTSLRSGTRWMMQGSFVRRVAAMSGSTEFFAPLMVTSPCSGLPPLIKRLSIWLQQNKMVGIVNDAMRWEGREGRMDPGRRDLKMTQRTRRAQRTQRGQSWSTELRQRSTTFSWNPASKIKIKIVGAIHEVGGWGDWSWVVWWGSLWTMMDSRGLGELVGGKPRTTQGRVMQSHRD